MSASAYGTVVEAVPTDEWVTVYDIVRRTGVALETVRRHMAAAVKSGEVERSGTRQVMYYYRRPDMAEINLFANLTPERREALREIVADWISEGFTTPPYDDVQYDIFEALGLSDDGPGGYNTRRSP